MVEATEADRLLAWRWRPQGFQHITKEQWLTGAFDNSGATLEIATHREAAAKAERDRLRETTPEMLEAMSEAFLSNKKRDFTSIMRAVAIALADALESQP